MNRAVLYTAGDTIGAYQITNALQQTRSGHTYLAHQEGQETGVILEVFQPLSSAVEEERFLIRGQTLLKLHHPHILPVLDTGVHNHRSFLVIDSRPRWTLREIYPVGSRQPLAMLVPQLKSLASALDYAHQQGVVHGDLRPEQILLDQENTLLLTGFAMEAAACNQGDHGNLPAGGTHRASDHSQLAALVYALLCGTVPPSDVTVQRGAMPSHLLRGQIPAISRGVERTLIQALESKSGWPFPDAQAFVSALEEEQIPLGRADPTPSPGPEAQKERSVQPPAPPPLPPDDGLASEETHPLVSAPDLPPPQRERARPMTRRVFSVICVGLAALGGAGSWYLLKQRLLQPAVALTTAHPAMHTMINNTRVLIFTGHLAGVNALAWSPDGTSIVSASDDTFVQIFNARSGRRAIIYTGHTEEVAAVGWSPDGQSIASGGQDGTVRVWRADRGTTALIYRGHTGRVNGVSWSKTSQSIASGSDDKSVQVWDARTGTPGFNLLGHTAGVLCVGWQPDDGSVASGSWDGTLRDWAISLQSAPFAAGEQIFIYRGHGESTIDALAWSPDSTLIASTGADRSVQISHANDGTSNPPFFTGHTSRSNGPVLAVAWSPDGTSIASGDSTGTILVWKVADRKTFFRYTGHTGAVNALAWSPDGKTLASAGADTTVQVWQPG